MLQALGMKWLTPQSAVLFPLSANAGVKQWSGKHSFGDASASLSPGKGSPMTDRMTPTVPELKRITELANEYRQQLVADLAPEFPGREAHARAAVLAVMFATSMTSDPAQQSDQARILNEIMSRWQPALPWQLIRRPN